MCTKKQPSEQFSDKLSCAPGVDGVEKVYGTETHSVFRCAM